MIRYLIASILLTVSCGASEMGSICSPKNCYTVVQDLGEGAFGKVYQVKNKDETSFALKSYKPIEDINQWWSILSDVQREFKRGQQLDHPHIIHSVELFSRADDNYLVLEFVRGNTLFNVKNQSISFDRSILAAHQFIEALRYGLTLDLYHLDLHGGNVMMTDDSEIMVVDLASFFSYNEVYGSAKKAPGFKQPKKLKAFFEKNPDLQPKLKIKKGANYEPYRKEFNQRYFDAITNICVTIIKKSDLDRDYKIELQADIKKLAWNYKYDVEEGIDTDLNEYFDLLIETLNQL